MWWAPPSELDSFDRGDAEGEKWIFSKGEAPHCSTVEIDEGPCGTSNQQPKLK